MCLSYTVYTLHFLIQYLHSHSHSHTEYRIYPFIFLCPIIIEYVLFCLVPPRLVINSFEMANEMKNLVFVCIFRHIFCPKMCIKMCFFFFDFGKIRFESGRALRIHLQSYTQYKSETIKIRLLFQFVPDLDSVLARNLLH